MKTIPSDSILDQYMLLVNPPTSPFEPPSLLYRLLPSPLILLVQCIYHLLLLLRGPASLVSSPSSPVRLVCISDTHTKNVEIPDGDVLVHAGDMANRGTATEIQNQLDWLASLPHRHKVVVAGNHDSFLDPRSRHPFDKKRRVDFRGVHYLQHSSVTLTFHKATNRQLVLYGAPQIPKCGGKDFAFQYPREQDAWSDTVPPAVDVLITHTPPRHHLDLPHGMGCKFLLKEVWRVKPKVHVFGHVHAGHGAEDCFWDEAQAAYERVCAREHAGLLMDCLDPIAWLDVLRVTWHGVQGILWSRVWRGDGRGTRMINASLAYRGTGELKNPPQVVDI